MHLRPTSLPHECRDFLVKQYYFIAREATGEQVLSLHLSSAAPQRSDPGSPCRQRCIGLRLVVLGWQFRPGLLWAQESGKG